ncbi:MAG: hypothetical protein M3Z04_18580 [Chloroflexota bacterium]|nr:hypothetical protein [Chloroflexota bacterium]
MTTKELIQTELERMTDEQLAELYAHIHQRLSPAPVAKQQALLESLLEIQVDGLPEDFSVNWEHYVAEWEAEDQGIR